MENLEFTKLQAIKIRDEICNMYRKDIDGAENKEIEFYKKLIKWHQSQITKRFALIMKLQEYIRDINSGIARSITGDNDSEITTPYIFRDFDGMYL